jgi:predicted ATPase
LRYEDEGGSMANPVLSSLEINQFRAFNRLLIENFGRVNLVVGKNNVGKTTFLEALWLYTQRARPLVLIELLRSRDEYSRPSRYPQENSINSKERIWDIKHLFYGHIDLRSRPGSITIGPANVPDETLYISIRWYTSESDEEGVPRRRPVDDPSKRPEAEPYLVTQLGNKTVHLRLERVMERRFEPIAGSDIDIIPSRFLKANGLSAEEVAQLWDNIALTDWEETVVDALHIIAPEVRRISFLGAQERHLDRIPVVRINGIAEPVSLRSMGEGMNRLLGVILALVSARSGILLVDEIESGLHYSVQTDIWRIIFEISRKLNVQVFATTHSWDCIEAFQRAAVEDSMDEGVLIRLENRGFGIGATLFNERRLSIATKEQVEVR